MIYNFTTKQWENGPALPKISVGPVMPQPSVKVVSAQPFANIKVKNSFWKFADSPTVYDQTGHPYSSEAEFLKAGGKWGEIQVKNKIPTQPNQPIKPTVVGFLREIPGAIQKVKENIGTFAASIPQSTARFGASVLLSKIGQDRVGIDPSATRFEKELYKGVFGGGPLRSIRGTGEDTFQTFGADKLSRNKFASTTLGLGLGLLDFTGAGGEKNAIRALTSSKDVSVVSKILKNIGVADDFIKDYAPILAKADDEVAVAKIITRIDDLQKTTKTTKIVEPLTTAAKRERGFITSAKEAGMDVKATDTIDARNRIGLAIKAKNLVKDDIVTAEKVAQGTDDKAVAVTSELLKYYDDLSKTAKTTAEQNLASDKMGLIINETARNLTEAGRTIEAAKILNMQTPEGNLRFAARLIQKYNDTISKEGTGILGIKKKIPELTGQQAKEILDESKRVFALPEGEAKAIAYQKLQNKIRALIPSSALQKVITVWKAGLLTGAKTTFLNISANVSHGGSEVIKDIPAAVVDKIVSVFTGKRTLALTGKGSKEGIAEGFKKGLRYFRTGYDERNIAAKLDYNKVNFTSKGGKVLQKYTDTVFGLLGAEDQPFYYGAKARSLYSQAIAEAKNAGLKGAEQTKFIDNLVANPTPEMIKYATHDAEIAVFQNKTALGGVARKIQNIPGGEVIVPFGRTPASVATQLINYSPVGIVKTIVENIGKGKFDQRMFSQGIGRGITGTGALYIGMELYKRGRISLGFPESEREKRQWEIEGRKPNSILINGKWRSIAVLGPAGNVLTVGGYLQDGLDKTGSFAQALVQATTGGAKSLTEQTFLQGLNSFTQAIVDPVNRGSTLLGNLMGSVVPTLVSDTAQGLDPLQRRSSASKDGLLTPIQARVPGLRNKLEPKVDVFGAKVKRIGNVWETFLDPTRPSNAMDNPVIKELRRLNETGNLATPTYFADDKKLKITQQERTALQQRAGRLFEGAVRPFMNTEDYLASTDEEKAKKLIAFTDRARVKARAEYVAEKLKNLSKEERNEKLKELKASGVMTKEVYSKWKSSQ